MEETMERELAVKILETMEALKDSPHSFIISIGNFLAYSNLLTKEEVYRLNECLAQYTEIFKYLQGH